MFSSGREEVTLRAMFRDSSLAAAAVAVISCFCAIPSHAASSAGARVLQVQKDVSSAGAPLKNGGTATAGAPVVTGADSRVELKLASGATVRIGQGSAFSFDGANLSLSRGSALFKLGGTKAKIATPAFNCAASAGVISAHSTKSYEACFVIEGAAVINGVSLRTGEGFVRENGAARKIAFDVKRMLETSFLVTKFPKAPWVAEAFAAAAIQSELLAANRAQSALLSGRANANATTTSVRAASAPLAPTARPLQSAGAVPNAVAANTVAQAASAGVSGGTLYVGGGSASSGTTNVAGATVNSNSGGYTRLVFGSTLSLGTGSVVGTSGGTVLPVSSGGVTTTIGGATNVGVLNLTGGGLVKTGVGSVGVSNVVPTTGGGVLTVTPGTLTNGNLQTVGGVTVIGGVNGVNWVNGVNGVNGGILNIGSGGSVVLTNGSLFVAPQP